MAERLIPSNNTPSRESAGSDLRTEVYVYKILATFFAGLAAAVSVGTAVELLQIPDILDQLPKETVTVLPLPAVLTYVGFVFERVYRGREKRLQEERF